MANVRSKDTSPELEIQNLLKKHGREYSTHVNDLPGKPDIVLSKTQIVIFIHGCFWHHHEGCKKGSFPKTRKAFWRKKILANVERDKRHISDLKELGWKVVVLWECEIEKVVNEMQAKRVVLDSVNLFLMLFETEAEKREVLAELASHLAKLGCTTMMIDEIEEGSKKISHYGFEEFVVDGVIVLYRIAFENMFERAISVIKMRGSDHSKAIRAATITKEGLKVYPDQEQYHKQVKS